jgi:hypothetical protein
MISGNAAS